MEIDQHSLIFWKWENFCPFLGLSHISLILPYSSNPFLKSQSRRDRCRAAVLKSVPKVFQSLPLRAKINVLQKDVKPISLKRWSLSLWFLMMDTKYFRSFLITGNICLSKAFWEMTLTLTSGTTKLQYFVSTCEKIFYLERPNIFLIPFLHFFHVSYKLIISKLSQASGDLCLKADTKRKEFLLLQLLSGYQTACHQLKKAR